MHALNGEIICYVDYYRSTKLTTHIIFYNKTVQSHYPDAAGLCTSLPVYIQRHLYFYIAAVGTV